MCLALPCFAYESTISYVNINDLAYQDVEVVIDNNQILVPFKQLADIFEIKYEATRAEKQISFTTIDGRQGMVTQQGVFVEDMPISKQKPIFVMQGIIEGVFNEAYVPASVINEVMGVQLEPDFETLTLSAQVNRNIKALANANPYEIEKEGPRAYQDVVAPKKSGKITLKTIGLRDNLQNDRMGMRYYNTTSGMTNFTNMIQQSINGDLLGGKYRIEATEFNYTDRFMLFGGLTGSYKNKFKISNPTLSKITQTDEMHYELGKVRGIIDEDAQMGTQIFGGQLWNYDYDKTSPQKLSGYVKPTSLVRVTVNDLEPITLSTYAGYYTLKDVQLPNPVRKIKLEEVNEDGTVEFIKEEKYSIFDKETPLEKEHRGTVYAGVWGYQNRLFRDGAYIYRGDNKKFTAAAEYQYGLKENITLKSKASFDKIYEKTNSNIIYRIPTNDSLLVTGTQKSVNYLEGVTSLNSAEWKSEKNKAIKARATGGVSVAHDVREHSTHFGYMGQLTGEYDKDLTQYQKGIFKPKNVRAKLTGFHTSPDWFIASSDSSSKNDRTGGRVQGGLSFNSTSVSGGYSRYMSNMNHRYRGGRIDFDEANIAVSTVLPYVATARFSSNYRRGANDLGRNKNYNYDASLTRDFGVWARLSAGRTESLYDTKFYHQTVFDRNYYSKYSNNYIQLDVPLPRNFGKFMMGHDMVSYKTDAYKNDYNMFRFGYTFPTWHRFTPSIGWGFRYRGQGGSDFNVGLAYRAKSGQTMNFNYQYSKNGGYFIDNLFTPSTTRHSIFFTFDDAFQVCSRGLRSVGEEDTTKGLFEAIAFVDIDKNGKFDKKIDIPIRDIPLLASWASEENFTNKRGRVYSQTVEEGIYTVSIDMDKLPLTVAPLTNDKIVNRIKIDGGKTTRLEIPLLSTVGSVSGVLKISDDFGRELRLTDFIVVLLDDQGNEVNYSTLSESGDFYISGLAPGRYTLKLDENFVNEYGLEEVADKSEISIIIPYDYQNPTDITDIDLEYKTISL